MLALPDNTFCKAAHGPGCITCLPKVMTGAQRALLSFRRRVFDRAFDLLDMFIVLSEHSRGVLEGYGIPAGKIEVVPLTLPVEYEAEPEGEAPAMVPASLLFVGWLNDRKGVHAAIEAMPGILAEVPDARLYVIGGRAKFGSEYEERFNRFIAENGLTEKVEFLGHLPPATVKRYVKSARVLLLPEQYENMSPLVMVEAMLLGTPVVASGLGGIPEYIEDGQTGFLADARDPATFAAGAVKLLKDPDLREAVVARALKFIREKNDNDRVWRITEDAYLKLARRGRTAGNGQTAT